METKGKNFQRMQHNEQVIAALHTLKAMGREVVITKDDLDKMGFITPYPTTIFTKYAAHWVRNIAHNKYKIVAVSEESLQKKEPSRDGNKPLPITGKYKVDMRNLAGKTASPEAMESAMQKQEGEEKKK